jgi:anti-sigma regulatory factor (Ser/Thr protein kinase)
MMRVLTGLDQDAATKILREGVMTASDQQTTGATDELVLTLLPSPRTVGQARRAVRQFCRSGHHESLADDAELLTSEVMTNACRYSTGVITVLALRNTASVVVRVTDDHTGGDPLLIVEQDPGRENGRGLFLVDAIAGAWGTTLHAGGTSVWFRLP